MHDPSRSKHIVKNFPEIITTGYSIKGNSDTSLDNDVTIYNFDDRVN